MNAVRCTRVRSLRMHISFLHYMLTFPERFGASNGAHESADDAVDVRLLMYAQKETSYGGSFVPALNSSGCAVFASMFGAGASGGCAKNLIARIVTQS